MLETEINVPSRNTVVLFVWYNDLFSGKAILQLSPGKHCLQGKVVYLDLQPEGFACL